MLNVLKKYFKTENCRSWSG